MSIIFVLIPIAVLFVLIGLGVFFWAVRSRQFDDLDKEAYSILCDNQSQAPQSQNNTSTTSGVDSAGTNTTTPDNSVVNDASISNKDH
jgi:cbb3-type cytochrome oxidase maturation protein